MLNKKITKFVSSAVLLESASALGLQAQGGVTSNHVKSISEGPLFGNLGSGENLKVFSNSKSLAPLAKLLVGVVSILAIYCILCNVERKLVLKKYDACIGNLEKTIEGLNTEVSKLEREIKTLEIQESKEKYDDKIKECNKEIPALKKEKEQLEKKLEFLKERNYIYEFLQEIKKDMDYLDKAHLFLSEQMQIDGYEANNVKYTDEINLICKELKNVGFEVKFDDFFDTKKEKVSDRYRWYYSGLEDIIKDTLKKNGVLIVYKSNKKRGSTEEIDVEAMKFTDEKLKKDIQDKVSRYKALVENKGLCEEAEKLAKKIIINKEDIERVKQFIQEQAKVKITADEYKAKVKELLEKLEKSFSILEKDVKIKGAGVKLKEKLTKILESKERMGTIANGFSSLKTENVDCGADFKLVTCIEKEMELFSKEKDRLEKKIKDLERTIEGKEVTIKRYEQTRGLYESSKEDKLCSVSTNVKLTSLVKEKLDGLMKKRNAIEKEGWYKLHILGNYYNVAPSADDY